MQYSSSQNKKLLSRSHAPSGNANLPRCGQGRKAQFLGRQ